MLLQELAESQGERPAARYVELAALLEDAKVERDENSLLVAQRGLQRVYARQIAVGTPRPEHYVQRGRILQALDELTWALRRLTPAAEMASLEAGGHAQRFLEVITASPGVYSGQIAELLDAREDVVSRVGARLESAGFARKTRVGRRKHWYITPRGTASIGVEGPDR
jgi:DNA-binding MarR family transcriptional regulator